MLSLGVSGVLTEAGRTHWRLLAVICAFCIISIAGISVYLLNMRRTNKEAYIAFQVGREDFNFCLTAIEGELTQSLGAWFLERARDNPTWCRRYSTQEIEQLENNPQDLVSRAGTQREGFDVDQFRLLGVQEYWESYRMVFEISDPDANYAVPIISPDTIRFLRMIDVTFNIHGSGGEPQPWVTIIDNRADGNDKAITLMRQCLTGRIEIR